MELTKIFVSPITPRYREPFYSSIPVTWQDQEFCITCLPCARDTFTPPTQPPIVIDGQVTILP